MDIYVRVRFYGRGGMKAVEAVFKKDGYGKVDGPQKTTGFPVWLRQRVHVRNIRHRS